MVFGLLNFLRTQIVNTDKSDLMLDEITEEYMPDVSVIMSWAIERKS